MASDETERALPASPAFAGTKVVPPFVDFRTPPPKVPMKTVPEAGATATGASIAGTFGPTLNQTGEAARAGTVALATNAVAAMNGRTRESFLMLEKVLRPSGPVTREV